MGPAARSSECVSGAMKSTSHTKWKGVDLMTEQRGRVLPYLLLWMLGVPASLLIILFLLGVGR
jgi:hypothetical protein